MPQEIFDIVDDNDHIIDKATRKEAHDKGLTHRSVFFFIINKEGKIFVNQRSKNKRFYPGYWSVLFGGHVSKGDSYEETVKREVKEEAGIDGNPIFLQDYKKRFDKNDLENGKVYAFITDKELKLDKDEIDHGSFLTLEQAEQKFKEVDFIPESKYLFEILKNNLRKLPLLK